MNCKGCDRDLSSGGSVVTKEGLCVSCSFAESKREHGELDWNRILQKVHVVVFGGV